MKEKVIKKIIEIFGWGVVGLFLYILFLIYQWGKTEYQDYIKYNNLVEYCVETKLKFNSQIPFENIEKLCEKEIDEHKEKVKLLEEANKEILEIKKKNEKKLMTQ